MFVKEKLRKKIIEILWSEIIINVESFFLNFFFFTKFNFRKQNLKLMEINTNQKNV